MQCKLLETAGAVRARLSSGIVYPVGASDAARGHGDPGFIGIADGKSRATYSQVRDHSKHRLRRAIRRLERDSVLLHSNQPTSTLASSARQSIARPEISLVGARRPFALARFTSSVPPYHPGPLLYTPLAVTFGLPLLTRGTVLPSRGLANGPSAVLSDRFASLQAGGREMSTWNERERTENPR